MTRPFRPRRRACDRRDDRAAGAAQRVDLATAKALFDAFRRFDADATADVAVLTGAGGAFCAGADLKALAEGERRPSSPGEFGPMGPTRLKLAKPVIAAVEGPAIAGGMELALWCDLRIAARSTVFGLFNRRFGMPLIDLGTIRLPRIVGHGRALELILTGRAVGAEEALRIGLVNELTEDGEALARAWRSPTRFPAFRRPRCATTACLRSSNGISADPRRSPTRSNSGSTPSPAARPPTGRRVSRTAWAGTAGSNPASERPRTLAP